MSDIFLLPKRVLRIRPFNLFKAVFFRVYGVIKTRRLSTRAYGFFKIYNRRHLTIGKRCSINTGVILLCHSDIIIEDDVTLSHRVMLLDTGLDLDNFINEGKKPHIDSFVRIEKGAWIGAGALILPGVTIGEFSIVGAGSVVTKDVKPYSIVAGNPAKFMAKLKI